MVSAVAARINVHALDLVLRLRKTSALNRGAEAEDPAGLP
jgi:hypothetical protein